MGATVIPVRARGLDMPLLLSSYCVILSFMITTLALTRLAGTHADPATQR